jgi:hypothetical protein
MSSDPLEVLSSFVDGELVDPDALAAALMAPGGRETLLDFARLRSTLAAEEARPGPEFYTRMSAVFPAAAEVRRSVSGPRRLALAAVVVLGMLGLVDVGLRLRDVRGPEQPPRPDRVLQFQPGVDWKATSK